MRLRTFAVVLAALLLSWPVAAQEQRGSIEGIVKDASGAVLPGATVSLVGNSGVKLDAVSDGQGLYRFPSLLPGTYTVSANLQGFGPGKVSDVPVTLGAAKKVDFALSLAGVTETVQVTAESPLVDVKQSAHSTDIRKEQVELLPHGRDFTTMITQAPGANNEPKSGGIMIDGSSAAENRYIVDGMETTDLVHGQSGKPVIADFVEEIQVKSTGYSAEYGGSTGAVINVLTKSGTNNFSGTGMGYYQGSRLAGQSNQTLRLQLANNNLAEYHTFPKDQQDQFEPGGSIGGPIFRNKMWFYGAYLPTLLTTDRHVDVNSSGNPNANTSDTEQTQRIQNVLADTTMQMGSKLRTRVSFNDSYKKTTGQLANISGTDKINCAGAPAGTPITSCTTYTKGTNQPNYSLSGQADYTVNSRLFVTAKLGRFLADTHDFNTIDQVQFNYSNSNIGLAGVPSDLQHANGFSNIPSNSAVTRDTLSRNYGQIDATYYGHLFGDHSIKGGIQIDHRGENINSGNLENILNLHWGQSDLGQSGPFGYYEVRSNAVSPRQGIITVGNVQSKMFGIFLQDQWSVNSKLTINGGIRTENENVPAYTTAAGVASSPIKFGMGDKIAPRVGFSYDLKGDGSWKTYGDFGVFYDVFKLELPQGSFGGQKWISYFYTLDQADYTTLRNSSACPPACPGTQIGNSVDFRAVSVTPGLDVEQNLKPMQEREASFGVEHQLNSQMAVTARYIYKHLVRGIEDTGDLDPTGNEAYIIANPGEGQTAKFDISTGTSLYSPQGATNLTQTLPKPRRNYNALEFGLEKRFSHGWFGKGTYTLSRDAGNYPGLSESDESGRSDPNVGRSYDYPAELFTGNGQPNYGVFQTDRTNQLKLDGIYTFKFGTTVGAHEYIANGTPVNRQVAIIPNHGYPIYYNGRGSDGRLPMYSQLDVYAQHEIGIGGSRKLEVDFTVLNVLDQRTAVNRADSVGRSGAIPLGPGAYTEAQFYAGQLNFDQLIAAAEASGALLADPRFLQNNSFQAPITARFGVKFKF